MAVDHTTSGTITRVAADPEPTTYGTGDLMWESDTKLMKVWDGAAWYTSFFSIFASNNTWTGTNTHQNWILMGGANELRFRDSGQKIWSSGVGLLDFESAALMSYRAGVAGFRWDVFGSQELALAADTLELNNGATLTGLNWSTSGQFAVWVGSAGLKRLIVANTQVTLGGGAAGVDYRLFFDGETNDGTLDWMEDEDYFRFNDDVLITGAERLYVGSTGNFLEDTGGAGVVFVINAASAFSYAIAGTGEMVMNATELRTAVNGGLDLGIFGNAFRDLWLSRDAHIASECEIDGALNHDGTTMGFAGAVPVVRQTVTGSRSGNAALASLLTGLATEGLVTDSSSAGVAGGDLKQTEIDFGVTPVAELEFTIVDADVSPTSQLMGGVAYEAPTGKDLDELEMDQLDLKFAPDTGQFKLYVTGLTGYVAGTFKINYLIG